LINTYKELANQKVQLSDEQIENIVNMFKQFKESDVNAYNVLLENFKAENPELIEKILPLLE
jgi:predicted transcriptional regulator